MFSAGGSKGFCVVLCSLHVPTSCKPIQVIRQFWKDLSNVRRRFANPRYPFIAFVDSKAKVGFITCSAIGSDNADKEDDDNDDDHDNMMMMTMMLMRNDGDYCEIIKDDE